jgi:dTDP-4-amino-4,6-dideoxygalactose transaminase
MLRDHGQAQKYYHDVEGYNGRLDAIQAGILRVKLKHLARWNEQRRKSARCYDELLDPLADKIRRPQEPPYARAVYHLYVIRADNRDQLSRHLAETGIGTGIHYPVPLHLQKAYHGLGHETGDFPISESAAAQILSLPMYPGLRRDQQTQIVRQLEAFVSPKRAGALVFAAGVGSA